MEVRVAMGWAMGGGGWGGLMFPDLGQLPNLWVSGTRRSRASEFLESSGCYLCLCTCVSGRPRDCNLSRQALGLCPDSPVTQIFQPGWWNSLDHWSRWTNATGAAPAGPVNTQGHRVPALLSLLPVYRGCFCPPSPAFVEPGAALGDPCRFSLQTISTALKKKIEC